MIDKLSSPKQINLKSSSKPLLRDIAFNKLTSKDKKDIKSAIKLGCNWIALSYLQNEKLILEARKLIKKDMGIISKIENKHALKNIIKIMNLQKAGEKYIKLKDTIKNLN